MFLLHMLHSKSILILLGNKLLTYSAPLPTHDVLTKVFNVDKGQLINTHWRSVIWIISDIKWLLLWLTRKPQPHACGEWCPDAGGNMSCMNVTCIFPLKTEHTTRGPDLVALYKHQERILIRKHWPRRHGILGCPIWNYQTGSECLCGW